MITAHTIYWITRLDSINNFFTGTAIFSAGFSVIFMIIAIAEDHDFNEKQRIIIAKISAFLALAFILSIFTLVFVPSTKEAAAMYLIPKIANNETVKNIPPNLAKVLDAKLEQWIKETVTTKDDKKY